MKNEILASAGRLEHAMTEALIRLCSVPAVSPHSGGTGEDAKIIELAKIIDELGLKDITIRVEHVDDDKAPSGRRPSLFLEYPGRKSRRLCILSHIDVVPEGDRSAWTLDPFKPEVRGSRIYGRGVSDNGMCLTASLFALKSLQDAGITPEYTVLLAFVADEELGSSFFQRAVLWLCLWCMPQLLCIFRWCVMNPTSRRVWPISSVSPLPQRSAVILKRQRIISPRERAW